MNDENTAPVQCRNCEEMSAFPTEEGYTCENCGYFMSWGFFKMWKLKCGCEQCQQDLQQDFWKKIPPFDLEQDYQDFQI
ncbi:MAG: hypothetical protein HQM12_12930 [SAR324 cluster bacterium]|nr:hypothetical protein [SAR324 cluster bacterium]MBF0351446.1 hypothetical protein [SAR324 cluster bacterium]